MAADENQNKKEVINEARKGNSALRAIDGHLSSQEFGVGIKKFKKKKKRVVLRGDIVKDDPDSHAIF